MFPSDFPRPELRERWLRGDPIITALVDEWKVSRSCPGPELIDPWLWGQPEGAEFLKNWTVGRWLLRDNAIVGTLSDYPGRWRIMTAHPELAPPMVAFLYVNGLLHRNSEGVEKLEAAFGSREACRPRTRFPHG